MVAFRILQRGVYSVFSDFSKGSATDSPHLKEIQSQKKHDDVPPKRRRNQINLIV